MLPQGFLQQARCESQCGLSERVNSGRYRQRRGLFHSPNRPGINHSVVSTQRVNICKYKQRRGLFHSSNRPGMNHSVVSTQRVN
ncbi:unnamed protein product, partial [Candidula unifasciata]